MSSSRVTRTLTRSSTRSPTAPSTQYLRVAEHLGIERMVLVQPSYYGTDNRLTLDVLRKVGSACRGVVQVDDDISDAELDDYHRAGVRAIRLDLFAPPTLHRRRSSATSG